MIHPRWKVKKIKGEPVILPDPSLYCPFCGERLLIHAFGVAHQLQKGFYHADVNMKCPGCCFYVLFGIPIDRETYEELRRSKLVSKVFTDELLDLIEEENERREIEERLRALGYW